MADFDVENYTGRSYVDLEPTPAPIEQLFIAVGSLPEPDTTIPVVGGYVPADGVPITKSQGIQLDATDAAGLRRVVIWCSYPSLGTVEIMHDGDSFRGPYAAATSVRTLIAGGFRYVVTRHGGWPATPTFEGVATDVFGNERRF